MSVGREDIFHATVILVGWGVVAVDKTIQNSVRSQNKVLFYTPALVSEGVKTLAVTRREEERTGEETFTAAAAAFFSGVP